MVESKILTIMRCRPWVSAMWSGVRLRPKWKRTSRRSCQRNDRQRPLWPEQPSPESFLTVRCWPRTAVVDFPRKLTFKK